MSPPGIGRTEPTDAFSHAVLIRGYQVVLASPRPPLPGGGCPGPRGPAMTTPVRALPSATARPRSTQPLALNTSGSVPQLATFPTATQAPAPSALLGRNE